MSLVCWSGGADSTLVLYDLLRERRKMKKPTDVDEVRTISVCHMQVGANKEQRAARRRVQGILRKRGFKFESVEIRFLHYGDFHVKPCGCAQAMVWLSVAMPYLRSGENLYIGYVGGDSVWAHWAPLRRVFDSGATLLGLANVDLITPLYGVRKPEVLTRLRRARLIRATWTCEDPKKGKACGGCLPCRTRALALYELRRWPKKS